ncbi:hypothetical protein Hanom_Chr02g00103001 [Helianthus anomalus]
MSPGDVRSVDTGVEKTKGCPSVSPPSCMGNQHSETISHKQAANFCGDPCVGKADNYEERENGGDIHSVESHEREEVGHDSDGGRLGRPGMEYNSFSPRPNNSNSPRPNYITTRPNKSFGSKKQAQGVSIPDLNLGAVTSSNSDPVDIEAVFHMEKEGDVDDQYEFFSWRRCGAKSWRDCQSTSPGIRQSFRAGNCQNYGVRS